MSVNLGVGIDDFKKIIDNNIYYVDKTLFIEELLTPSYDKVVLIKRPRRFGKSLMLSMLKEFFSIKDTNINYFEGLNISQNKYICEKWQNKYPVISISLKEMKKTTFSEAIKKFVNIVSFLYDSFENVINDKKVS